MSNKKVDFQEWDFSMDEIKDILKCTELPEETIEDICQEYHKEREREFKALIPPGLNSRKEIEKDFEAYKKGEEMSFFNNVILNLTPKKELLIKILARYEQDQ